MKKLLNVVQAPDIRPRCKAAIVPPAPVLHRQRAQHHRLQVGHGPRRGGGLPLGLQIAQAQGTRGPAPAQDQARSRGGTCFGLLQPASADAAPVDFSKIPPELLSEMDAEVAKLPVSAEQNSWRATIWRVSTSRSRPWPTPSSPNNA
jgi:hypothetical protein